MDLVDRFSDELLEIESRKHPGDALTELAQRYSYVLPDETSLSALGGLGPLVELAAGTGYWAYRLAARGVDVIALDQAPPDGDRPNRYHAKTRTWTTVASGDETALSEYPDRALFLCWPPLFSSLGECLTYYTGEAVALIGDGGHRTARIRDLNETFTNTLVAPVQALEPFPGSPPTLSTWRRRRSR